MDPKAPRTATATLVLGLITWVLCVASVVFKLGLSNGFGIEEDPFEVSDADTMLAYLKGVDAQGVSAPRKAFQG